MDNSKTNADFYKKILEGIQLAVNRMIVKTAANYGEIVVSENGKVKLVKAKDLLSNKNALSQ